MVFCLCVYVYKRVCALQNIIFERTKVIQKRFCVKAWVWHWLYCQMGVLSGFVCNLISCHSAQIIEIKHSFITPVLQFFGTTTGLLFHTIFQSYTCRGANLTVHSYNLSLPPGQKLVCTVNLAEHHKTTTVSLFQISITISLFATAFYYTCT